MHRAGFEPAPTMSTSVFNETPKAGGLTTLPPAHTAIYYNKIKVADFYIYACIVEDFFFVTWVDIPNNEPHYGALVIWDHNLDDASLGIYKVVTSGRATDRKPR